MKRLLIIDGQNMFIRNYVMSPQLDINGNPIGGLTGFMRSLQKEVRRAKPDRVVVCWEGPGGSQKRREKNKNYKLGRKAPKLNREYEFATPEEERENKYDQLLRLTEYLENLPILQMSLENVEADDIIAVLCKKYQSENIVIVSADKDFIQLHKYPKVKQYSPNTKKMVNGVDPNVYIKEHVLKGDSSDGIPNVLSPDNTFVDGLRQKPLGKKKIEVILQTDFDELHDEVKRNYQRNEKLINLDNVPEELELKILNEFDSAPCGDRSKLLNYFTTSKLKTLTESIGEF